MIRLLLVSLLLLTTIAGCGTAAVAVAPAATAPIPAASPAPSAAPSGLPALARLRQRLATGQGFSCEVTSISEGTWDDGEDRGVRRTTRNRARLEWSRPHRLHGEMLEAPFALMVGGTMDTTDGQTLTLRPKGLLSVVAMTVAATDVKLRNARNHTFRDSQPASQLARLSGPTAVWSLLSASNGVERYAITGVPRLDAGVTRECLSLSAEGAPVELVMEAGTRTGVRLNFTHFSWR